MAARSTCFRWDRELVAAGCAAKALAEVFSVHFHQWSGCPSHQIYTPRNNCSSAGRGRSKFFGNTFKRFWLRDKILKLDNPENVSDSKCFKPKRPKSSNCKLSKGANISLGKTGNLFAESDNRCKHLEEAKASSATLVMFCSLKLTSLRLRTPTRLQLARCFAPWSLWWQRHGKHPKSAVWIG